MQPTNPPPTSSTAAPSSVSPRRTKSEFPIKVYAMLELAENIFEFSQAASWLPHGRAFRIHNKTKFMAEIVPIFFNQTKIRSFNRQLHLWGFRRIGRGNDQVWWHEHFLRGKPESMKNMVRTKIKGTAAVSEDAVRVPNFDELPPLPTCDKLPPAVLDVMENAIMKLPRFSGAIAPCGSTMLNMPSLPAMHLHMDTVSPRSETCDFHVNSNSEEQFSTMYAPPSFLRRVSCESPTVAQYHLPLQVNSTESLQPMSQLSGDPFHLEQQSYNMFPNGLAQSSQFNQNFQDFEPLPFTGDDEPCDDFANFIEGAIRLC